MRVVLDTNILVAGLRSRSGASFEILQRIGAAAAFRPIVSTPLCLEYEAVLLRSGLIPRLSPDDIRIFLDYFVGRSSQRQIHFLWRHHLPDRNDDLVFEAALAGNADLIVTHNVRHFPGMAAFGIRVVTPGQFLSILGAA